jgi:tetratricopeptide (TPR) repeat protein
LEHLIDKSPEAAEIRHLLAAARAAQERRDWPETARLLAELRDISPDRPDAYTRAATALRHCGRADDADALLEAARVRFPASAEVCMALGQQAHFLGAWDRAATHWQAALAAAPGNARTHVGYAQALRAAERHDEAETVMRAAMERFPGNADVALGHAAAAAARQDWPEAERRWAQVAAAFRDLPAAHTGHARFWLSRLEPERAKALADAAEARFPENTEVQALQARIAKVQGLWHQALFRWDQVLRLGRSYPDAHVGRVQALTELGDFAAAEVSLHRLPAEVRATPNAAWAEAYLATRRGDLPMARLLWQRASVDFPDDRRFRHGLHNVELRLVDQAIDLRERDADAPAGPAVKPDEASLATPEMRRLQPLFAAFQSLGDNCEFGTVQRAFGEEPISLLRWTRMPLEHLIDALVNRFAGVGDPAQTTLDVERGEYHSGDSRFHMYMHTFIRANEVAPDILLPKLCARLRFLVRNQIEDLTVAEKIFLFRSSGPHDDGGFRALHEALRAYGPNRLLIVTKAEDGFAAGTIRHLAPTCLVGAISSLDIRKPFIPGWQTLIEAAHDYFTTMP